MLTLGASFNWMFPITITVLEATSTSCRKHRSRLDVRKNFFSNRVVTEWNKLPAHVVEADTVMTFKNRLDACNRWGN